MSNIMRFYSNNKTGLNNFGKPKQLVPGKSGNVTSIKRVTLNDGSETTHSKEISNTFNSFFVSVAAKLASKVTSDTTKTNPPVSRHEF